MSLKNFGAKTILIAEDDTFNMQLLQALLANISTFKTIPSYDGAEALEILNSSGTEIDMILLDIRMPIMTGEEFLKEIKGNTALSDIPVLVISVDQDNEAELREMGAVDFIQKPFDINDLEKKISAAFGESN
ncbi:response regulator [Sulfurovum sp. NBC37-1]|uniref:response regulator n=1 Tax=Sulfurovum sp. (strain NBC37-1) TaxID=387093 RepID=UPI0001587714|nr:response regulator [Sulfurovum sp. NBC37-1]BAF71589.1 two-component response regulator [Sulfurovum sp. NBC37-1]